MLPSEIFRLPFEEGPFRMAMGLVSCPASELIELDDHYPAEMAERCALPWIRAGAGGNAERTC